MDDYVSVCVKWKQRNVYALLLLLLSILWDDDGCVNYILG